MYWCRACGRYNTEGMRRPRHQGRPLPYKVTLCLGALAAPALDRYCQATGLSPCDAVRQILRLGARPLILDSARRLHEPDGSVRTVILRPPRPGRTPPRPGRSSQAKGGCCARRRPASARTRRPRAT